MADDMANLMSDLSRSLDKKGFTTKRDGPREVSVTGYRGSKKATPRASRKAKR